MTSPADLCQVVVAALEKFGAAFIAPRLPCGICGTGREVRISSDPIDENALSDVITRFLRTELGSSGIFANREVEISRAPGAPVGQRTDIFVNAVRCRLDGELFDPLAAVVETKGCWNDELFTALEGQLFRSYMIRCARRPAFIWWAGSTPINGTRKTAGVIACPKYRSTRLKPDWIAKPARCLRASSCVRCSRMPRP